MNPHPQPQPDRPPANRAPRAWAHPWPPGAGLVLRLALAATLAWQAWWRLQPLLALPPDQPLAVLGNYAALLYPLAIIELVATILLVTGSFVSPIGWLAAADFIGTALLGGAPEPWSAALASVTAVGAALAGAGALAWRIEDLPQPENAWPYFIP